MRCDRGCQNELAGDKPQAFDWGGGLGRVHRDVSSMSPAVAMCLELSKAK